MENVLTESVSSHQSTSIWQSLVLGFFEKMDQGYLKLILPNRQVMHFGDNTADLKAEIEIQDKRFFKICALYGDIGFGDAYVEGLWITPNITNVISWFLLNINNAPTLSGSDMSSGAVILMKLINKIANATRANTIEGSRKNISEHYDLNNTFFSLFLDPTMTYSAAYFRNPGMTLEEAQYAKYEALCQRIHLKKTDHVLEIGTGWGGNAIYMAKNYGCKVTTTTISQEQYMLAKERIAKERLEDQITVLLSDYRDLSGHFDKIVSIEMLEAVGHQFLKTYFAKCHQLLKKDGLLGIQVITCPDSRYKALKKGIDWIQKYIFPGSLLPSIGAINKAINQTGDMTLVNLQDMGVDYGKTLNYWYQAFNTNWNEIRKLGFDESFKRKWNYYLCYCEAAFNMRNINVMQMVYTRPNNVNWL